MNQQTINRFSARHAQTMAALDATFDGALIHIAKMTADCPAAPTLHARINDAGLETAPTADGLEVTGSIDYVGHIFTGNDEMDYGAGGEAKPADQFERVAQVWPLQSSESWTERS